MINPMIKYDHMVKLSPDTKGIINLVNINPCGSILRGRLVMLVSSPQKWTSTLKQGRPAEGIGSILEGVYMFLHDLPISGCL
jgi:hydrogenase maturation factor